MRRRRAPAKPKAEREVEPVDGLKQNDPGIAMLANAVQGVEGAHLLLVCAGALPGVDPLARRVVLDVRELKDAPRRAEWSTVSQWLENAATSPTAQTAVVWPRAHLGKDFTQLCIAIAEQALAPGGRVLCAVRKQKGADSVAGYMAERFGSVRVQARNKGYRLLCSEKKAATEPASILACRYQIRDSRLGDWVLHSAPGAFARKKLDLGTQCLIDHATQLSCPPARVVDLGAGVGPLSLWAARRWPQCSVVAVESNTVSAHMLRENVRAAQLTGRVFPVEHAGLPSTFATVRPFVGTTDLTLTNPPTHASAKALDQLLGPLAAWQRKGSLTLAVVNRPAMVADALTRAGADVHVQEYARYCVLEARW